MSERPPDAGDGPHLFARLLQHPRLGPGLAGVSLLLALPSLLLGFRLDDHMHRYMLSDLPGGADLLRAYESPFGIANGEPADIAYQLGQGYAPWWTDEHLLVSLFRPVSEATHRLDALLWPGGALPMHLHNLAFWALLVLAATRLYRRVMGPGTVAGLAALFYAFDHTHGFAIGWIANRNALVAALFAVLALTAFVGDVGEGRAAPRAPGLRAQLATLAWLSLGLLSGEGAIAIAAYLFAHALFLQPGPLPRRLMRLLPAASLVVVWRVVYHALGRGAEGSGLYLDPVREPLRFAVAALERAPVLLLGELALPPAEAYVFLPLSGLQLALAVVVFAAFVALCWPLLRRDAVARFWALGALLSLVPACSTHPNNRLLFFAGVGLMALLSQLWHGYVGDAAWLPRPGLLRHAGRGLTAALAGFHLLLSPLLLPLTTLGVAVTAPLERAVVELSRRPALDDASLFVVNAPDYYATKLLRPLAALAGGPVPRHVIALGYGEVAMRLRREGERTLVVDYGGGLMQRPTDYLYSHPDARMEVGFSRTLPGVRLRVLRVTADGRPASVRFDFDAPLDSGKQHWVRFEDEHFVSFTWAEAGDVLQLPPARVPLAIPGT